jgi:hypothetical protein
MIQVLTTSQAKGADFWNSVHIFSSVPRLNTQKYLSISLYLHGTRICSILELHILFWPKVIYTLLYCIKKCMRGTYFKTLFWRPTKTSGKKSWFTFHSRRAFCASAGWFDTPCGQVCSINMRTTSKRIQVVLEYKHKTFFVYTCGLCIMCDHKSLHDYISFFQWVV